MKRWKIGVVGAGHLGKIHARLLAAMPDVELVAIVDPIADARLAAAEMVKTQPLADHRELIGKVDAAVVAAPTSLHHDVALDLLAGGLHLLVEKPLASNAAQAKALVAAAKKHQRVLQVGHIEQFNPAIEAIRPRITRPSYIEASRASGYTFRCTDVGVVLDLMIHDLDIALSLAGGEVAEVEAWGLVVCGPHEDVAKATLRFENGCVAQLSASRASPDMVRSMQIYSEDAFASIDFGSRTARVVRPRAELADGSLELARIPLEEKTRLRDNFFREVAPLEELRPAETNPLVNELRDFLTSLDGSHAPRVTGEQGLKAQEVAERILSAMQLDSWRSDLRRPAAGAHPLPGPHWSRSKVPSKRDAA